MPRLCLILLVAVWLGLAGPSGAVQLPGSLYAAPQTDREQFNEGLTAWEQGRQDEALRLLRAFVIQQPDSPFAGQAALVLARIFYLQDSFEEARLYLERAADRAGTVEYDLLQAALAVADGRAREGLARLQAVRPTDLGPRDRYLRARAMVRALAAQDRGLAALLLVHRTLDDAEGLLDSDNRALQEEAHRLLGALDDADLAEAGFMLRGTTVGQIARLVRAERLATRGETADAL
ncbi:MAG: hypothetical protein D6740_12260, partial [Alphaproteobacteria bacterium]